LLELTMTEAGTDAGTDAGIDLREGLTSLGKDAYIARLHQEAPLERDVNGFWVASRFDDVRAILLDHRRFSSSAMGAGGARRRGPSFPFPLLTDDPPRHTALRGLLAKAFTPAAMEKMRPAIEQLAGELAGAIPRGAPVDIVAALTTPLPVAVIAGMMGVPNDRAMDFKRWSNAMLGHPGRTDRGGAHRAADGAADLLRRAGGGQARGAGR
jgi:cytochrome P450